MMRYPYRGEHPHAAGSDTSAAAAKSVSKVRSKTLRKKLFEHLLQTQMDGNVGLTDEEMQRQLGMQPNTQRPRRRELVELGAVADSGQRRKTASGRSAVVWEPVLADLPMKKPEKKPQAIKAVAEEGTIVCPCCQGRGRVAERSADPQQMDLLGGGYV